MSAKNLEELSEENKKLDFKLIAGYMNLEFIRENNNLIKKMIENEKENFILNIEEYEKIVLDYESFFNEVGKYFYFCIGNEKMNEYENLKLNEPKNIAKEIYAEKKYLPKLFNAEEFLKLRRKYLNEDFDKFLIKFALKTEAYEFLNYLKNKFS